MKLRNDVCCHNEIDFYCIMNYCSFSFADADGLSRKKKGKLDATIETVCATLCLF